MCCNKIAIKKQYILLIFFLLVSLNAFNQVKNLGLPYLINYTVEDYKAHKQNWMAVQDKRGIVYFANTMGVLEFDGQNWNLIKVAENPLIVRALGVDKKGRVYVGCPGKFGYLSPDSIGKMTFISLVDKIENEELRKFKGINSIFIINDKIYFAGDEILFEYSGGKVKGYVIEGLRQTHEVNGRIFMRISQKGLYEWINGRTTELPEGNKYKNISFRTVLPYGDDIMIVTAENGLLIYDEQTITKLETSVDKFLKKNKIISAIKLSDGNYALGMFSAGLIIMDKNGNVIQHVDTHVGLKSDLIANIFQDNDGNLWLMGNSISYVLNSLPLSKFSTNYGLNNTTYVAMEDKNALYIGNAAGIYTKNWNLSERQLNNVETFHKIGEPHNVWHLDTVNGSLFAATNMGIDEFRDGKIRNIIDNVGTWKFLRVNNNQNLLIAGTNEGLVLLEFKPKKKRNKKKSEIEGNWSLKYKIKGFSDKCRHIVIDPDNNIWVYQQSKGIRKLVPSENFDSVLTYSYDEKKGLAGVISLSKITNKIIVGTNNGLFRYDNQKDIFVEDELLNLSIGKEVKIRSMVQDSEGNIWYKQQRKIKQSNDDVYELGQLILQSDGSYLNYKTPFYKLKNNIHSLSTMANGNLIIGAAKGFVYYNPNINKDYSKAYHAMIRKVEFVANDSLIFDGAFTDSSGYAGLEQKADQVYKIPYHFNDIRFNFSSPFYDDPDQIKFKFYLEGNDDSWSDWKAKSFKEYSNLSQGDYVFRVVAKNIYEVESEEATYYLTILPPWYRTVWAIIGYIICAILLIWAIVRLSVRRLRKQKEHLEQVVEERTTEIRMKNTELEQQKEEILAQRDEIEAQRDKLSETNEQLAVKNKTIEDKNKNITASITYAKRIQEAMLPLKDKIEQTLDDYFILFKPRDIVSGDFYWFAQKNDKIIFAAVDCTGHGVPGAFMSMIGSEILTTIVNQGITIPSEILDYKNRYVRKALKQEHTDNQDGMDMSLCTIDRQNKIIEWAGAKNPIVYIKNNELFYLKGDMQSIGGHQMVKKQERDFTNHIISYADGPTYFYIFTDGFQDQFGGPSNRKYMVKRMKELIHANHLKPMKEQEKILNYTSEAWMKDVEQTDDILVIGFKLVP